MLREYVRFHAHAHCACADAWHAFVSVCWQVRSLQAADICSAQKVLDGRAVRTAPFGTVA